MSSHARSAPDQPSLIQLTDIERSLRQLLLDVADHIDKNVGSPARTTRRSPSRESVRSPKEGTELRFTGGWVRDKLLGIDSHDIDVGINNMTGIQFGLQIRKFLSTPGTLEKYRAGAKAEGLGGLHKIAANPEKSKHLETVATKIFGLDVDLVNLRKETYSEDSRNPQMEFGTPREDALRRDATINALFYNLNTSQLEDFTGCGLNDMREKIIRTPLEPYQTFKDDPLRVLRLIRFASRFGYSIDPESEESMSDRSIREFLRVKITRERVGIEVEKMLKGPDPRAALLLIDRLGLYFTVFSDPEDKQVFDFRLEPWKNAYNLLWQILTADESKPNGEEAANIRRLATRTSEEQYQLWTLTALLPWNEIAPPKEANLRVKSTTPKVAAVAREGLKAPSKLVSIVVGAVENVDKIIALKDKVLEFSSNCSGEFPRDELGMFIRGLGPSWRLCIVFSLLVEAFRLKQDHTDPAMQAIVKDYSKLFTTIERLDLLEVGSLRPTLDGNELMQALERKPGVWLKDALDASIWWQLRNPDRGDRDGALDAVKRHLAQQESGNGS